MSLTDQYLRTFDFHDGSHYQKDAGAFDPAMLANVSTDHLHAGRVISWKATQGTNYKDPTFATLRNVFVQLFDVIAWYHWVSSASDPVLQAKHFLDVMGTWSKDERASIDAEEYGVTAEAVIAYAETVEAVTHRPCIVYTGLYVDSGRIWRDPRVRNSKYGPRPMHLAAYVSRTSLIDRMLQLHVADLPMHMWQYSSNGDYVVGFPASLPGVTGRADLNHVCDWSVLVDPDTFPSAPPTSQEYEMSIITNSQVINQDFGDGSGAGPWMPRQVKWGLVWDNEKFTKVHLSPDTYVPGQTEGERDNDALARIPDFAGMAYPQAQPGPVPVVQFPEYQGTVESVPGVVHLTPLA